MKEPRCECLACFGFRLAVFMLVTGFAVLALLAVLIHAGEARPLLISGDDGSGGAVQSSDATLEATAPEKPTAESKAVAPPVDAIARSKFPAADGEVVDMFAFVNRLVNAAITGEGDLEHYGVDERFVSFPEDARGDCEDYALTKMELLGNLGMPLIGNAVLQGVAVGEGDEASGHMVLQLRLPSGAFLYLDNQFDEPMTRRELVAAGYHFFDWSDR